jgi:VanZ family protein
VSSSPSLKVLFRNWWPVALWLVVIRLESTDSASSGNTFGLIYRACAMIFGHVAVPLALLINEILRKSGHFIGYAILSALVFLALKHTHRDRLQPLLQRTWETFFRDMWQFDWALIAVLFSLITASLDEMHQVLLPSRTGRWQDVLIDTSGALLAQLLLYARATHTMNRRRRSTVEAPELTLTH